MEKVLSWVGENRWLSGLAAGGAVLLLVGGGWYLKTRQGVEVEIIDTRSQTLPAGRQVSEGGEKIWVDVQGAVERPGVYELTAGARVKDALAVAGGLAAGADRSWVERYVNLAQKAVDGGKMYIPAESAGMPNDQFPMTKDSASGGFININSASQSELDSLSGIGQVRAKAIVDGRPYGGVDELVSRKILPQNVYEKIKEQVAVW